MRRMESPSATVTAGLCSWSRCTGACRPRCARRSARGSVPWAVLALYVAGLGLAWQYRGVLAHPGDSPQGILLSIKIGLAASVAIHVVTALVLARGRRLTPAGQRRLHISVFWHMVGIVVLAKAIFHVTW